MNRSVSRLRGFTLIEIVVTLTLLSLLTALVVPNLNAIYDAVNRRTQLESFVSEFNQIGVVVRRTGREFTLEPNSVRQVINMPEGWSLEVSNPVVYRANGACLGGTVSLVSGENRILHADLSPPRCTLALAENQ